MLFCGKGVLSSNVRTTRANPFVSILLDAVRFDGDFPCRYVSAAAILTFYWFGGDFHLVLLLLLTGFAEVSRHIWARLCKSGNAILKFLWISDVSVDFGSGFPCVGFFFEGTPLHLPWILLLPNGNVPAGLVHGEVCKAMIDKVGLGMDKVFFHSRFNLARSSLMGGMSLPNSLCHSERLRWW